MTVTPSGALLASAARTATTNSTDQDNIDASGVIVFLDVTSAGGGGETLALSVQAKDPVSANYVTLLAFGTQTATGTYAYTVYPAAAETTAVSSHEVQALPIPRTWRVKVTHSASASWTYSVGYSVIP